MSEGPLYSTINKKGREGREKGGVDKTYLYVHNLGDLLCSPHNMTFCSEL